MSIWDLIEPPQPRSAPVPPCLYIALQDLEMVGTDPGEGIGLTGWSGWLDGAPATGGPLPWPDADGGVETDVYMSGRTIVLEGTAKALTPSRQWEQLDRIGRVLTSPRWDWLVVDEGLLGLSRQMRVSRLRRPQMTQVTPTRALITLELQTAGYPKLGVDMQTLTLTPGQTATAVNLGDYPAALTAVLTGPLTNPRLSTPQGSWQYTGTIAAGKVISVDFSTRMVRDPATSDNWRRAASGLWHTLPGGETAVTLTGTGTGSVTLTWRSSWT